MPEISMALIIKIVAIIAAIGCGVAVVYSVKKAVSNTVGRQLRRAGDLLKTINDATEERQNNAMQFTFVDPNVVNSIKKDFPDYDEKIAKSIVENTVMKYFLVINGEANEDDLEYCTAAFKQRVATMAKDNSSTASPKHYDDIHIHKSQVASYHKDHDAATATFQVSLEYKLNNIKTQHIYEADYSYYLSMGNEGENASLICQFCGAPVDTTGDVCPYCGAEIHSSVERTWKVSRIAMLK